MEIEIKGKTVLIDPQNEYLLHAHKWQLTKAHGGPYVVRNTIQNGKWIKLSLHRLITNCPPGMEVDHINGNPLDNRLCNLRICKHSENCKNQKIFTSNTTGKNGVYWDRNKNKYGCHIRVDGKDHHLGFYDNKEDAVVARENAEIKYYKEYKRK